MKVYELLEVLQGGIPTVRIIDANAPQDNNRDMKGVLLCDFLDNLSHKMLNWQKYRDFDVTRFKVQHEVSHKRYKELGLIPPYRPDLTAEYELGELNQKTYYDIYIDYHEEPQGITENEEV